MSFRELANCSELWTSLDVAHIYDFHIFSKKLIHEGMLTTILMRLYFILASK